LTNAALRVMLEVLLLQLSQQFLANSLWKVEKLYALCATVTRKM